jgi:hypothetical protein
MGLPMVAIVSIVFSVGLIYAIRVIKSNDTAVFSTDVIENLKGRFKKHEQ